MAMWPPSTCLFLLATIISLSISNARGAAPKGARFRELQLNQFLRSELSITKNDETSVETPTLIDEQGNGDVFHANLAFEITGSPSSDLYYANPKEQNRADSATLSHQQNNLKEFLSSHDVYIAQKSAINNNNLDITPAAKAATIAKNERQFKAENELIAPIPQLPPLTHNKEPMTTPNSTTVPNAAYTQQSVTNQEISTKQNRTNNRAKYLKGPVLLQESVGNLSIERADNFEENLQKIAKIAGIDIMTQKSGDSVVTSYDPTTNITHYTVYVGNSKSYINNSNYHTITKETVVVDANNEKVKIVVAANMKKFNRFSSVMFMIYLLLFIFLAIVFKNWVYKLFQDDLLLTLNSIIRDNIVLIFFAMLLKILNHYNELDFLSFYIHVKEITLGLLIFSLLWAMLGVFMVIITQINIQHWGKYELNFSNREKIFRDFEDLYLEPHRTLAEQRELNAKKLELEYFLIRQEFISPTFLPVVGEDFVRDDFEFARYLGGCMAKASAESFRYAFSTILATLVVTGIFLLLKACLDGYKEVVLLLTPLCVFLVMLMMKYKLAYIYTQIVNIVHSPYDVNFTKFESLRQPLINLGRINLPPYLQSRAPPRENFTRWIKSLKTPNRHELLFWFSTPKFMLRLIHVVVVVQLLWTIWFCVQEYEHIEGAYRTILAILAWIITVINLFYLTPLNLRAYCLVTSIQMLKDRSILRSVASKMMTERSHLMQSLYRFLKAAHRETQKDLNIGEAVNSNKVREFVIRHVREDIAVLNANNEYSSTITVQQIRKFGHLCGRKLSSEEIVYFARGTMTSSDKEIQFEDVMEYVVKIMNEVLYEPAEISRQVLEDFLKREKVTPIVEFKKLLTQSAMLDDDSIERIMREIRYLPLKNAEISIELIATLIRDSIQEFAR